MQIEKIHEVVSGIPHMNFSQAKEITNVIIKNDYQHILELGFSHGVSTCYMAGALDELGRGSITTIDLAKTKNFQPNVDMLLDQLDLRRGVTVYYEPTSYVWRLLKMLEEDATPRFDLCFLDGVHDWFTDGFAFYLVDKLLKENGLIIFDDLDWSYDRSAALKNTDRGKKMPDDEKQTHQIRKVYEILVKTHPAYGRFVTKDGWAYAYKMSSEFTTNQNRIRREIVYKEKPVSIKRAIRKIGRKMAINI